MDAGTARQGRAGRGRRLPGRVAQRSRRNAWDLTAIQTSRPGASAELLGGGAGQPRRPLEPGGGDADPRRRARDLARDHLSRMDVARRDALERPRRDEDVLGSDGEDGDACRAARLRPPGRRSAPSPTRSDPVSPGPARLAEGSRRGCCRTGPPGSTSDIERSASSGAPANTTAPSRSTSASRGHGARLAGVVRDVEERDLQRVAHAQQVREDLALQRRVHGGQRLVEQEQARLGRDGAGQGHALALAARERRGEAVEQRARSRGSRRPRRRARSRRRPARIPKRTLPAHVEVREEAGVLRHVADPPASRAAGTRPRPCP